MCSRCAIGLALPQFPEGQTCAHAGKEKPFALQLIKIGFVHFLTLTLQKDVIVPVEAMNPQAFRDRYETVEIVARRVDVIDTQPPVPTISARV